MTFIYYNDLQVQSTIDNKTALTVVSEGEFFSEPSKCFLPSVKQLHSNCMSSEFAEFICIYLNSIQIYFTDICTDIVLNHSYRYRLRTVKFSVFWVQLIRASSITMKTNEQTMFGFIKLLLNHSYTAAIL